MDLSEKDTRKKIIDPKLELVGWMKKYIKEEVKRRGGRIANVYFSKSRQSYRGLQRMD